jgi:hypothetical protein
MKNIVFLITLCLFTFGCKEAVYYLNITDGTLEGTYQQTILKR